MESVVAFEYFFFLFAKYLSIAAVASEFYGVYSFVVGSMQSVVDLLIYARMEVREEDGVLIHLCFYGM